jgi:hypothetical protein
VTHDSATCAQPTRQRLIVDPLAMNIFAQNPRRHEHRRIPQEPAPHDDFPVVIEFCEDDAELE